MQLDLLKNALTTVAPVGAYQDRCGYGPRLPFLTVSSYAKVNYVDHGITDQTSIIRFIEDNWNPGNIGNQSFDVKAGSILTCLILQQLTVMQQQSYSLTIRQG